MSNFINSYSFIVVHKVTVGHQLSAGDFQVQIQIVER